MGVKYVLSDPAPPTWWAKNKVFVCSVVSLLAGFYLANGCDESATPAPVPTRTHTTSPAPTATEPHRR
ncbi:hypothetical protein [Streptomyces sp. NPDC053720]|uniref:hypothetical protein n=1 Tax=Streptomyces sp. NPDC053720 TaxID=3154855 RepID=UPI003431AF6D